MITASHNPKQDNGYKLYGENGCQIIPPNDSEIAALIEKNLEPWNEHVWDRKISNQLKETLCPDPSYQLLQEYYRGIISSLHLQNSINDESSKRGNIKVCYTAMHGVGLPFAERMVETLGLPKMIIVEAQAKPDPEFPTVSFPNPEEKVLYQFFIFTICIFCNGKGIVESGHASGNRKSMQCRFCK